MTFEAIETSNIRPSAICAADGTNHSIHRPFAVRDYPSQANVMLVYSPHQ